MINELKAELAPEEIMRRMDSGLPKLWVAQRALTLRRDHPEWFSMRAEYAPIAIEGAKADHALAAMRAGAVITVVPRWTMKRGDTWAGTRIEIPPGRWKNLLTGDSQEGGKLRIQSVLHRFPVALLVKASEQ
jgi:(1->4)-alpha-D-glucan 1-alpha-D-glucosylmutase